MYNISEHIKIQPMRGFDAKHLPSKSVGFSTFLHYFLYSESSYRPVQFLTQFGESLDLVQYTGGIIA